MRLLGSLIILILISFPHFGQLSEDFSDGDFNNNPQWGGDTSEFIVNTDFKLQLNAPSVTDTSYLSVETGTLDFSSNISWEFYVKMDFSPSNNNNFRYYLASNNNNLEGYLNGYYIRVGENGSLDKLKLYRQDGISTTLLASSLHESFGINPEFRVRVNRDINGNWEILCDSTGGTNFIYELGATDVTHTFSNFSGLWSKHTSSNNDNIYFDDINVIGNIIIDSLPASVQNASVISPNTLEIQFSEPIDNNALNINNFNLIGNNPPNPTSVYNSSSGYELIFQQKFKGNQVLNLSIQNITDLAGNSLFDTIQIIVPDTAQYEEILINEILFDPFAGGSDYVEIINNSNSSFDIFKYYIADYDNGISNLKQINQHFIINPNELILFTEDSISTINDYPSNNSSRFIQMDLPSFPNDSATVFLLNADSIILDQFSYSDDLHFELINDPEGVSLERVLLNSINPNIAWHSAAENVGWGTPGNSNSQYYLSEQSDVNFYAENEVFSPDNDGFEDIAIFSYKLDQIGMVGNAFVYDNRGRLIKSILTNELLNTEGKFTWDGINQYGQKAAIGIYLIYFECFSVNGEVLNFKCTTTLKSRF
ncbi:MAG: lamin tail domain-containing protein [Crocinitomicaceae bacterium TMED135]|nr:MAG: lamin tail domain-containing protein [Crocinitomicaceae bacterium TMED135]